MAITSIGYERAINYAQLGEIFAHAGAGYSVVGAGSFAASIGAGTREVVVSTGRAVGDAIIDDSGTAVTLTGAAVASGERWDMIALRRNWGSAESSLVLIPGGASKTLPARNTDPGDEADQPLWLARFAAGQSAPQDLIDLRTWKGAGGLVARDLLVRDYLPLGSRVWVQGITWVHGFDSEGAPRWVPDSVWTGTTAPPYFEGLGWIKP